MGKLYDKGVKKKKNKLGILIENVNMDVHFTLKICKYAYICIYVYICPEMT